MQIFIQIKSINIVERKGRQLIREKQSRRKYMKKVGSFFSSYNVFQDLIELLSRDLIIGLLGFAI